MKHKLVVQNSEVQDWIQSKDHKLTQDENSYDYEELKDCLSDPNSQMVQTLNQNAEWYKISDGDESEEIYIVINKTASSKPSDSGEVKTANEVESDKENTEEYWEITKKIIDNKKLQKNIEKMYNQDVENERKWRD